MSPNRILVGRVYRDLKASRSTNNQEKFADVEKFVRQYFWFGSIYTHNKDRLLDESHPYPEFFAAGLYMKAINNVFQRAIVVAYGNSLADARNKMLAQGNKLEWQ